MKIRQKRTQFKYWVVLQDKDRRRKQHWKLSGFNKWDGAYIGCESRVEAVKRLPEHDDLQRQFFNYEILRSVVPPPII
jgi:hypothetical protein